jgi:DNA repair protein RadD
LEKDKFYIFIYITYKLFSMSIVLRQYQIEPVKVGTDFFNKKKADPSIMVLPTAAGKSIIIAQIAKNVGDRLLVIQPSKELLEQNYNKFINLGGEASIYSASMNEKEIGNITYATIGSIVNIAGQFRKLGIHRVIIDECDRFPREPGGMLRRFLSAAGITHVLGLTATPLKLQTNISEDGRPFSKLVMLTSKSKKGNFFKEIIHVTQIKEMVDLSYWSKLQYESYDFDSGKLIYNSTGADYTDDSIRKAYTEHNISDKIIKKIGDLTDRKAILVAVPSISEATFLAARLPQAAVLHSELTSKERDRIVSEFKSGILRIIVQVNILTVGFDYPELDCIITGRPTASLSWWYQFVGRVTRIHTDKQNGLVVDFVGSVPKFGKVEELYFKKEDYMWKLYGEGKKLLTGIPLDTIGHHIEGEDCVEVKKPAPAIPVVMNFGKYKDCEIKKIPYWYRDWLLTNIQWNRTNQHIKDEILRLK